jgi:GNAT superfamily N-acetyltransferase
MVPMLTTRRATFGDIDEFKNVVAESVLELCKDYYTPEQLKSLLAQYPGRNVYEKWIHERVLVVAESEGKIVGFAQYFPPNNSLEALHVLPSHAKRGIGKMLVRAIEKIARNLGAERILLDSSLNAVDFYVKCGYVRKESSTFKCNDRVKLDVVSFEKKLRS